jgi:ATP phosphoribosyltransferase
MYNDYQIADNHSTTVMRQKFDEVKGLEVADLKEIYDKLIEQRKSIVSQNNDHSLDGLLNKINASISEIIEIIDKSTQSQSKTEHIQKMAKFNHFTPLNHMPKQDTNEDRAYSKIRSEDEMNVYQEDNNSTLPIQPNNNANSELTPPQINTRPQQGINNPSNGISDNIIDTPQSSLPQLGINNPTDSITDNINNPSQNSNSRKRNSPMQGSIISNLTKSLFMRKQKKDIYNIPLEHRNRFHNVISQGEECNPKKRMISNQIDLLRLLLLFVALRPNCKYLSRVARVANTQLEVLMELI